MTSIAYSPVSIQISVHSVPTPPRWFGEAQISMSSVSNPYDNAKAESFFKTLKQEEVYLKEYESFADAEANLAVFIEQVYNLKRLHSS
jgi:transposase InsO family protein